MAVTLKKNKVNRFIWLMHVKLGLIAKDLTCYLFVIFCNIASSSLILTFLTTLLNPENIGFKPPLCTNSKLRIINDLLNAPRKLFNPESNNLPKDLGFLIQFLIIFVKYNMTNYGRFVGNEKIRT